MRRDKIASKDRIELEKDKELLTAKAEASLIQAQSDCRSGSITSQAQLDGFAQVFQAVGLDTQNRFAAYAYVQTLKERQSLDL